MKQIEKDKVVKSFENSSPKPIRLGRKSGRKPGKRLNSDVHTLKQASIFYYYHGLIDKGDDSQAH